MKRFNIFLLAVVLAFALGSCSSDNTNTEDGQDSTKVETGSPSKSVDNTKVGSNASDFTTFFNEALVGRSADNMDAVVNAVIHAQKGVFLIHRPGAINKPEYCKGVDDIKAIRESIVEDFVLITEKAQQGELPFYDCMSFDKEGAYFKKHDNKGVVEKAYKDMADMMYVDVSDEMYAKAKAADEGITITAVSTNSGLRLGFGQVEGKWYLLLIDIAAFDCGA